MSVKLFGHQWAVKNDVNAMKIKLSFALDKILFPIPGTEKLTTNLHVQSSKNT